MNKVITVKIYIQMKKEDNYQDGYNKAMLAIEKGKDPQKLFNACYYGAMSYDNWDKGWMNACKEKGAKEE